jgi:hypothetical protein
MSDECHEMKPDELLPFERALASLAPSPMERSRDQLLFEAGRQTVAPRNLLFWQVSAGSLGILSLVLALIVLYPTSPTIVYQDREIVKYVEVPGPGPSDKYVSKDIEDESPIGSRADRQALDNAKKMLQVRNEVLRFGVEMLPPTNYAASPSSSNPESKSDSSESLKTSRGTFATPIWSWWKVPMLEPKEEE